MARWGPGRRRGTRRGHTPSRCIPGHIKLRCTFLPHHVNTNPHPAQPPKESQTAVAPHHGDSAVTCSKQKRRLGDEQGSTRHTSARQTHSGVAEPGQVERARRPGPARASRHTSQTDSDTPAAPPSGGSRALRQSSASGPGPDCSAPPRSARAARPAAAKHPTGTDTVIRRRPRAARRAAADPGPRARPLQDARSLDPIQGRD